MKSRSKHEGRCSTSKRIAKALRLAQASRQALESLETRVMLSTTVAKWDFGTLPGTTSTSAIQTSPATTSGTGTAYTVGMQATSSPNNYKFPAANIPAAADASTYLAATGTADSGGNGGSEDGTTGYIWRVESGQNSLAPIASQGVEFDVPTTNENDLISVQWDMDPSSNKAESQFIFEYTTNVNVTSPTWIDDTQNLTFGAGDDADPNNGGHVATVGTSSSNDVQLLQNTNSSSTNYSNIVQPGTHVITNGSSSYTIQSANGDYAQINGPLVAGSNTAWLNDLTVSLPATIDNDPNFAFRIVNAATGAAETSVVPGAITNGAFKNFRYNDIAVLDTLTNRQTPSFETQPAATTVEAGTNASFTAVAQTYDPTTTAQWEFSTNGASGTFKPVSTDSPADIDSGVTYNSANGSATDTLTVPAVTAKNGYYYKVIFTDSASPSSSTSNAAKLTVTDAPTITTQPQSQSVPGGTPSVSFTAAATGLSNLTVQWYVETPGGTFQPLSNNAPYSGVTTDTLTITNPTSSLSGNQYEAQFTDSDGTSTTTVATLTVTRTALVDWSFTTLENPVVSSPPPTLGSGTLTPLGMNNDYNNAPSTDDEDITPSATAVPGNSFNEFTWRIRGIQGQGQLSSNGWSNSAPQYTQGAEIDVPASGYDNFSLAFDWYCTTQGVRDLQVQYFDPTLNSGQGAWVNDGSPYVASSNDYYGVTTNTVSGAPSTGTPTPVFVDLRGIADLSNVSTLKLRLVSAYDPSLPDIDDANTQDAPLHGQYAAAAVYAPYEQQELNFVNGGGTFDLDYGGVSSGAISYSQGDADPTSSVGSATAIANALNAMSTIKAAGGVTVINPTAGTDANGNFADNYTVIFNDKNNASELPITVDSSSGIPAAAAGSPGLNIQVATTPGTSTPDGVVQYNNTSGNWRFDNIIVTGDNTNSPPLVTTQPGPATFVVGGTPTTVSFTSTASSSDPATTSVQWWVSTPNDVGTFTPFVPYNAGSVNTTTSGSNVTSTLTITQPTGAANGDLFEAVFTDNTSGGVTQSNTAALTVIVPPTVSEQPISLTVADGSPAVFTAAETGGLPTPTVTWMQEPSNSSTANWQPVPGTDIVNTSGTTTVTSTLTIPSTTPANSGIQYEAIFSNASAGGGAATTNVSPVPAAVLTVLPPETTIANWSFPTITAAPDNSPLPTINYLGAGSYELNNVSTGETSATLSTIGFNTPANGTASGGPANDDITNSTGTAVSTSSENTLRIRNSTGGWDGGAPNDSEGAEIDFDATGYSNIYLTFDWFATTQSIRDLQEEYNLNPTNSSSNPNADAWVTLGSPVVATANDFYDATPSASSVPVVVNLTDVSAANNDPTVGIRLVSAYDPSQLQSGQPYEYTAATTAAGVVAYSGTSGNWQLGNISIDAIPAWLSPSSAYGATWNPTNNTLSVTGPVTINADPGGNTATSPTAEPTISASGSLAVVTINPPDSGSAIDIHLAGLSLTGGASAAVTSVGATRSLNDYRLLVIGTSGAMVAPTFNIGSTSTLDLADNDMAILYGSGTSPLATVQSQLNSAYDNGAWDKPGLTSSVAKTSSGVTALGYGEASTLGMSSFDGVTLGGNAVLVKYTLSGDAFLTGSVGLADYQKVISNFNASGDQWTDGSFDYTGNVGLADYQDVLKNFNNTLSNVLPGGTGVTPSIGGKPVKPTVTPSKKPKKHR